VKIKIPFYNRLGQQVAELDHDIGRGFFLVEFQQPLQNREVRIFPYKWEITEDNGQSAAGALKEALRFACDLQKNSHPQRMLMLNVLGDNLRKIIHTLHSRN